MSFDAAAFWLAAGLLAYLYAGYPLLMTAAAALTRPRPRGPVHDRDLPRVTVIVTAFNEAPHIADRLENLLALDYPRERLDIVVASDGCTDGTVERARSFEARGVSVCAFAFRRGKPAMLNDLVPRAEGEIVVLADARQRFGRGALRSLVARFEDPAVGAASGELILEDARPDGGGAVGRGVGLYWKYEKHIRRVESRVDSMVGATGAIYAIRRALYRRIPEDTVLDDVVVPMEVVRAGRRVVFESAALAFDRVAAQAGEEFRRKTRTLAGGFQLFSRQRWLLNPRANRLWLQTVSHKGLRLLAPVLLVVALVTSARLAASSPFFAVALAAQAAFYAAAAVGAVLRARGRPSRLLGVPFTFCLLNLATIAGFWRFVAGRQAVTWERARAAAPTAGWMPRLRRVRS